MPIVSTVPMRDRACDLKKKKKKSSRYSRRKNRERLRRHEARYGDQESPTTFVYRSDVYSFRNSNWASLCEYIGILAIYEAQLARKVNDDNLRMRMTIVVDL